jgi:hypothetical protein
MVYAVGHHEPTSPTLIHHPVPFLRVDLTQPGSNSPHLFQLPKSTLDPEEVEACFTGLASVQNCDIDFGDLGPSERTLWEEAKERGYFTLSYEKARNRLALLVLWEMYCWSKLQPTVWWFPSEKSPKVAVNVKTTGHRFGVKSWLALSRECRAMGLTSTEPNINGVWTLSGDPTKDFPDWHLRIKKAITENLLGRFSDRMGYRIKWNSLGHLWQLRGLDPPPP